VRIALFRPPPATERVTLLAAVDGAAAVAAADRARLLLLPAGVWPPRGGESADGPFAEGLATVAARHRLALIAGLVEEAFGHRFDSALVFGADGRARGHYRRVHLAAEGERFAAGRWGLVAPLECGPTAVVMGADLWVPEYIRALVLTGARLVVGLDRAAAAATAVLAAARALENGVPLVWAAVSGPAGLWRPDGTHVSVEEAPGTVRLVTVTGTTPALRPVRRHPRLYRPVCGEEDRD